MTPCQILRNLKWKKLACSAIFILNGSTIFSPCRALDRLLPDMCQEIESHLSYTDKLSLRQSCKAQQKLLHQRELELERQLKEEYQGSSLSLAYHNLPEAWKTPKILLRIYEQAKEMDMFAEFLPKPLLLFLCAKGEELAIAWKILGIYKGKYWDSLAEAAVRTNKKKSRQRDKPDDFSYTDKRYLYFPEAVKPSIEEWSAKGVWQAIKWKINGLARGNFGYNQDLLEAKALLDKQCDKGVWQAIKWKIQALARGDFGYNQDLLEAKALLDKHCAKGGWKAIKLNIKVGNVVDKKYEVRSQVEKALLEEWSSKGVWQAINMKIIGLLRGMYGYSKNHTAARDYIEEWSSKGVWPAIEWKLKAIADGQLMYFRNLELAEVMLEGQIAKGVWQAVHIKVKILKKGIYGIKKDRTAAEKELFKYFRLPVIDSNQAS